MSKENDALGDMMKDYEMSMAGVKVLKGLPLLARLDGRSFHTFTKGLQRPFDQRLSTCMIDTAKFLVEETHASIGYTQSDEISLAWFIPADSVADYMFDGRVQKMTSILAGLASAKFLRLVIDNIPEKSDKIPVFDCRVWQVPNLSIAAQAFLWRELDATKNSISMAAHAHFSHNSLQGLNGSQKQERLLAEKGINWNDYPTFFKRGTYVQRKTFERELSESELMRIPEIHRPDAGTKFFRSSVLELDIPPARQISNFANVIFNSESPITKKAQPSGQDSVRESILEL